MKWYQVLILVIVFLFCLSGYGFSFEGAKPLDYKIEKVEYYKKGIQSETY